MNSLRKGCLTLNRVRHIRTGKFKDLINYNNILEKRDQNFKREKNKYNVKDVSILELLSVQDIKSTQPKKYKKKKIEHNDDINIKHSYDKRINYNYSEKGNNEFKDKVVKSDTRDMESFNTLEANYNSKHVNRSSGIRIGYERKPKDDEKVFKNKEGKNSNDNIRAFNSNLGRSNGKHRDYWIRNMGVEKRQWLKKYICLTSFTITNSYINKKYHIDIKKKKQKEKGKEKEMMENGYSIFERRSLQLLDELKRKGQKEEERRKVEKAGAKNEENDAVNKNAKGLQTDSVDYENKNKIIKRIYKASINHVRDENLWKKYVQNSFVISSYLDASDVAILFWCFGKIGYRDNRLINLLSTIILKKINDLSCCAIALVLNSFKKLEIKKYDTIELLTNQFCFHISKWTFQDIALVANSLAFFYIYHKTFWKKCILKLQNNFCFSHPLHLCLIVSSLARLDIREGNVLLCLSRSAKRLAKECTPNNLSLIIHSFAKLKFHHPKFYNYLYIFVHKYLDEQLLSCNYCEYTTLNKSSTGEDLKKYRNSNPDGLLSIQQDIHNLNIVHDNYTNVGGIHNSTEPDHLVCNEEEGNSSIINDHKKTYFNRQHTEDTRVNIKEGKILVTSTDEYDGKEMSCRKIKEEKIRNVFINNTNSSNNINERTKSSLHVTYKNKFFDLQSLVLLLFSCTCLISCTEQMILKLTYLIMPHKEHLGNHKIEKLKYVSDYLQYAFPSTFEKFSRDIKDFYHYIDTYDIKKKKSKYCARWISELSRILGKINVNHLKNVYINNICVDIMLTEANVIIQCLGPYSYYINSLVSTSICDLKKYILQKKKYNVVPLSYHDWNKLNDYEEKIHFLYAFGRNAASCLFLSSNKEKLSTEQVRMVSSVDITDTTNADDTADTTNADDTADITNADDTADITNDDDTADITNADDTADITNADDTADTTNSMNGVSFTTVGGKTLHSENCRSRQNDEYNKKIDNSLEFGKEFKNSTDRMDIHKNYSSDEDSEIIDFIKRSGDTNAERDHTNADYDDIGRIKKYLKGEKQ
ncbi:heptatricopeptide repeat and RAP domain-containing protein [Plasmodium brasilianum]|uniref:Heptatricopeptide repeat and RAP domain-containing protein n=1 Tax=Plasmodium brasilianum TaxID=5824 RepID=A0ACB9Y3E3_PLABR|nr:heptatricopeptide repeat and RAP domain-containing protein [Plasmodium brasilianum]